PPVVTATISARALTVTASAANKIYDGTSAASVSLSDNRLAGDSLSAGWAMAAFSDANAGVGKTVTVSGISLSGADAANYAGNATAVTTATISPAPVTGTITVQNKFYDGAVCATICGRGLAGAVSGDDVSLSGGTANFCDAEIGSGKTVTATGLCLAGAGAGNYTLASASALTTASIVAAQTPVLKISMNADRTARLDCSGLANQPFFIQAATDLRSGNWTTISTNVLGADGLGSFIDTAAATRSGCFYRSMLSL